MARSHSVPHSVFHSVIVEYESEPGELREIYFGRERKPFKPGFFNTEVKYSTAMRALAITFFIRSSPVGYP
jgi:hypothetical protein